MDKFAMIIFGASGYLTKRKPVSYTHLDVYKRQDEGLSQKGLTYNKID